MYSNKQIKYILVHYVEILNGKITLEPTEEQHTKSGRNPQEAALSQMADINRAIISLSDKKTGWSDALQDGMNESMILHLCRSNKICDMQRTIINDCILKGCEKDCKRTSYPYQDECPNEGIITRLRKYLNSEGRDPNTGRFYGEANSPPPSLQVDRVTQ